MRWRSSQGKVPARSAVRRASHGVRTETVVGSALSGTNSSKTNSLAQRVVDLHTAAKAAETSVCSVRLLSGAYATP